MNLLDLRRSIIDTGLLFLPAELEGQDAVAMLLAIGLQESGFVSRRQDFARGFWGITKGERLESVFANANSAKLAINICEKRNVDPVSNDVWRSLEYDDLLAVCIARLILYVASPDLPNLGDESGAWDFYLRHWKVSYHSHLNSSKLSGMRKSWAVNYFSAMKVVSI